jgi:hypothetical protein
MIFSILLESLRGHAMYEIYSANSKARKRRRLRSWRLRKRRFESVALTAM